MARHASAIDTGAANHHIVDDGETALAADPSTIAVPDLAVSQDGSLVKLDATAVEVLRKRDLFRVEKVPAGLADDLIGSVSENIDDGVRGVKNAGLAGEVCKAGESDSSPILGAEGAALTMNGDERGLHECGCS